MEKKRDRIIFFIWLFCAFAARILYFLFDYVGVQNTYGLYDSAILRLEEGEKVLSSGLCFAYVNAAARMLRVFGNGIMTIFVWQLICELVALSLLFWGAKLLWSSYAALSMVAVLSVSPAVLASVRNCSPEQYFMFHFSIVFYFLALFYRYSRLHGWFKSSVEEIIVLSMGIYSGMLIAWNYMGFFEVIIMIYVVINNYRINDDKNRILIMTEKELEEKDQMMNGFGQIFLVLIGAVIGMFFTLLKYTGYTGYTIVGQFKWWWGKLSFLPYRTMDFETGYAITFLVSLIVCLWVNILNSFIEERKEIKRQELLEEERQKDLAGEDNAFTHRDRVLGVDYFITEDGREVDYLENPLPIPKKKHDREPKKFDIDKIAAENRIAMIFGGNITGELSENMKKAGVGIENVVKLKPNDRVEAFEREMVKDIVVTTDDKKETFDPIIDVLSLDAKDDFDIDIAPGDDFDL
ncbi:MAG: glycosyltransferase family 39 protein [Lachnospiraceae bacterium]|nr:glycosyltransferase family 39 protein [Lachnospiraceae bacterium]